MDDKLMYNLNDDRQNNLFCRLKSFDIFIRTKKRFVPKVDKQILNIGYQPNVPSLSDYNLLVLVATA